MPSPLSDGYDERVLDSDESFVRCGTDYYTNET